MRSWYVCGRKKDEVVGNKTNRYESKVHHWRLDIGEYPARIGTDPLYIKFRESDILAWAGNRYLLAIRIISVCVFAYGIAYYAEKTAIVKDGEKTDKHLLGGYHGRNNQE